MEENNEPKEENTPNLRHYSLKEQLMFNKQNEEEGRLKRMLRQHLAIQDLIEPPKNDETKET